MSWQISCIASIGGVHRGGAREAAQQQVRVREVGVAVPPLPPAAPAAPAVAAGGDPSTARTEVVEEEEASSPKIVPKTVLGTCVVCLVEDSAEVLSEAWLHRGKESSDGSMLTEETNCMACACIPCLKMYFEGIVAAGFDGACPRMRCLCCPRVVCEPAWAPLVEASVLESFKRRAGTLLSIQCGRCHNRGSAMVIPPAGHSYSSAFDNLMAITDEAIVERKKCENGDEGTGGLSDNASNATSCTATTEAFRLALSRYLSGEDADVVRCYDNVEAVLSLVAGGDTERKQAFMVDVLNCVEDSERRASLHIRFLRFHPMMKTVCCSMLHCFRCRVIGGHSGITCEQYEARRGHEDVCQCPGCGVYVVKGDGCDSIMCVCGHNFDWSEVIHERNVQATELFCAAHVDDPARAAAEILRRDPPSASVTDGGEDIADGEEEEVPSTDENHDQEEEGGAPNLPAVQELGSTQEPVPEPVAEPVAEPVSESVPEPVRELHLLEPGSPEEFRLANLYAGLHYDDMVRARALIYGEEYPHFTAQHATYQLSWPATIVQGATNYFGRPRTLLPLPSLTELRWEESAARSWLQLNQNAARDLQRRDDAASASLVEALYGGGNDNDDTDPNNNNNNKNSSAVITYIAAEHAREGLRAAPCPRSLQQSPLFSWLGIEDDPTHATENEFQAESEVEDHQIGSDPSSSSFSSSSPSDQPPNISEEWQGAFAESMIDGENVNPIPSPSSMWEPRTPRRFAPPPRANLASSPPEPATRMVSAVRSIGSQQLGKHALRWLAATETRQIQLRRAMAREEGRLSAAWVALWGRREPLFSSTKTAGGRNDRVLEKNSNKHSAVQAVEAAARRCAFLEAHPEHSCAEQAPMRKAFERRNYAAVKFFRARATAQRAEAWERMHSPCRLRICCSSEDRGKMMGSGKGSSSDGNVTASSDCGGDDGSENIDGGPDGCGGNYGCRGCYCCGSNHSSSNKVGVAATKPSCSSCPFCSCSLSSSSSSSFSSSCSPSFCSCYSSSSSFERACVAYTSRAKQHSAADDAPPPPPTSATAAARTCWGRRSRRLLQKEGNFLISCSSSNSKRGTVTQEERTLQCLADAWEVLNRSRIAAWRFAGAHSGAGAVASSSSSAASVAAVTALVIVPVLLERASSMCDCELRPIVSEAEHWRDFNAGAYARECERVEACLKRGGRALEGCECEKEREPCSRLVACPIVTRRLLNVSAPACDCAAGYVFEGDGIFGDLFG